MKKLLHLVLLIVLLALPALAALPDTPLPDPGQEARAVAIGGKLRCVVCQSESINDSQADMARDLRRLIRDRIIDGWSDAEIIAYARTRYGDFILLQPPLQANTLLLWLGPPVFLALAGYGAMRFFRRRSARLG